MDKYFPIWIKLNKIRVEIKIAKYVSSTNSSDCVVTERSTGELKFAGSNPDVSHLSIWDNIHPIEINIKVASTIGKITTNQFSQRLQVQFPSMPLFFLFF
jgi:hypothetical protein